jgi:hypothetical protein
MRSDVPLDARALVVAHPDVTSRRLDDETVLLHLGSGCYFTLDSVGSHLWSCLTEDPGAAVPLGQLHERLCLTYEVDETEAWEDLVALMWRLVDEDLVVLRAEG